MEKIKPSTIDDDEGIIDRNLMITIVTTVVRAAMVMCTDFDDETKQIIEADEIETIEPLNSGPSTFS